MVREYLEAVVSVGFLAVSSMGTGRWMLRLLPRNASAVDRAAFVPLCGLGVLGTLLFAIGQFDFSRAVIVAVLAVAAIFGIYPAAVLTRDALKSLKRHGIPKLAVAAVVFVLLVTVVAGLAPVTGGWENDAVAYHLLGPKVWLRETLIRPVADNCHTAFPPVLEVLFGALMSIGGDRAAGFSAVLTLSLFLLAIGGVAMRAGLGPRGAWWTAALAATMPAIYAGSHTAFVDVFYASMVLAAARIGFDAERNAEFLAFGLFSGFAIGTKYTGVLAVAALLACLCVVVLRNKSRAGLSHVAMAAGVAALAGGGAYVRNWVLLGSPIYPPPEFLLRFFHPKYLSPQMIHEFQAYILQRGAGLGRGPAAFLLLPFQLTFHTSNFHGAGGIGLAPLALGPLGLLASRRVAFAKWLASLAVLFTLEWFVTQQESRFLIHVYAISAVFGVLGWRYVLGHRNRWAAALAATVVALSLLYGGFMIASGRRSDLHAAVSRRYAEERQREEIPFYRSFEYLNRNEDVRKVLILDRSVPPYYLDKSYVKPFGQWGEQTLPPATTSAEVLARLKELGITHILDVNSSVKPFQVPQDFAGLTAVLNLPDQRIYRVGRAPSEK